MDFREVAERSLAALVMSFKGTSCRLLLQYSKSVIESLRVVNILQDVRQSPAVKNFVEDMGQWVYVPGFGTTVVDALTMHVSSLWPQIKEVDPRQSGATWRTRYSAIMTDWGSKEHTFR